MVMVAGMILLHNTCKTLTADLVLKVSVKFGIGAALISVYKDSYDTLFWKGLRKSLVVNNF